jgi:Lrp/AsnC family leucine-responsive transcriptional regulator
MKKVHPLIDETNARILALVQENGRIANAEIARQIGLAPSAVFERLRKLEEHGLICGYEARLDPRALGLELVAFVFVRSDERLGKPEAAPLLAAIPEVLEVHHIAGEDCYLVKVRAAGTAELGHLLREKFGAIPSVRSTRTTIVLTTVKETARLPLPHAELEVEHV